MSHPSNRRPTRPSARRARFRPSTEVLEGRALMSYGGSPDLSFGNEFHYGTPGVEDLGIGNVGSAQVSDEAVQPDGKIVVAGSFFYKVGMAPGPGTTYFALTRLNADGSTDHSFGNSAVLNGFGRTLLFPTATSDLTSVAARSVAIQPDGKIVAAGDVSGKLEVVRLNADGSLDTTFGSGGSTTFNFAGLPTSDAERVVIQADGKILVAGFGDNPSLSTSTISPVLGRLNADGSIDNSFGTQGQVALPFDGDNHQGLSSALREVVGLAVQPDGKIVVDGSVLSNDYSFGQFIAERLNVDGTPDTTFGNGGKVTLPAQFGGTQTLNEHASTLLIQPNGKLVLVGEASVLGTTLPNFSFVKNYVTVPFAVRVNADGSIDTSFGNGGAFLGDPNRYVGDPNRLLLVRGVTEPVAATLLGDNKILLAGADASSQPSYFVRLNSDGSPDLSFGKAGLARYTDAGLVAVATQPGGSIVAAFGQDVVRLIPRGATGDFNNDGIADPAIYLPSYGSFAYRPSGGGPDVITPFGLAGQGQTLPAPASYDGEGVTELGAYLPSFGSFAYRSFLGGPDVITPFGIPGDGQSIPVPGDYDGSGHDELAVYLPAYGVFAYRPAYFGNSIPGNAKFGPVIIGDTVVPFGFAGVGQTIPAPGDYFGTGQTDIAAYLPSLGAFALRDPRGGPDQIIPFGIPGAGQSIPMPGDYDGSGRTELAVYLPAYGAFAYRPASGLPDVVMPYALPGTGQTLPAPGDYDGVGVTEVGVYLPRYGAFAYQEAPRQIPFFRPLPGQLFPFGNPGTGKSIPFNQVSATGLSTSTIVAASVEVPLVTASAEVDGLDVFNPHKKARAQSGG